VTKKAPPASNEPDKLSLALDIIYCTDCVSSRRQLSVHDREREGDIRCYGSGDCATAGIERKPIAAIRVRGVGKFFLSMLIVNSPLAVYDDLGGCGVVAAIGPKSLGAPMFRVFILSSRVTTLFGWWHQLPRRDQSASQHTGRPRRAVHGSLSAAPRVVGCYPLN
jgi:hypothetical protein